MNQETFEEAKRRLMLSCSVLTMCRINWDTFEEAKMTLDEITKLLSEGNLTAEERQIFETLNAQLAGALLHSWLPFSWGRRLTMLALFLVGLYGLLEGSYYFLWAWLAIIFFSPRLVGELSFFLGRVFRILR